MELGVHEVGRHNQLSCSRVRWTQTLRYLYILKREKKRIQAFDTSVPGKTSPHLLFGAQDQRLGAEQDQLPYRSTGTSSGNCQETETCMVRAYYVSRQPLPNHPLGHLGGWATPWSAEEMLDGQHQRVDISVHTRSDHEGLLQK